jgi:hypothetical protein
VGVPAKCYRWRDAEDTDIFYALTISFIQVHIHFTHIAKPLPTALAPVD